MPDKNQLDKIEWKIQVPIFSNSTILKQLGIAIGIPFGLLLIFLLYIKAFFGVVLIALLFLLTFLFIFLIWGGKYEVGFELNKKGIRSFTLEKQAKTNRILNTITIVAGFFARKPTIAGAGILAQSRQNTTIKWKNIKKIKPIPEKKTIMINGGFLENIAVFCTTENYNEVNLFIQSHFRDEKP